MNEPTPLTVDLILENVVSFMNVFDTYKSKEVNRQWRRIIDRLRGKAVYTERRLYYHHDYKEYLQYEKMWGYIEWDSLYYQFDRTVHCHPSGRNWDLLLISVPYGNPLPSHRHGVAEMRLRFSHYYEPHHPDGGYEPCSRVDLMCRNYYSGIGNETLLAISRYGFSRSKFLEDHVRDNALFVNEPRLLHCRLNIFL